MKRTAQAALFVAALFGLIAAQAEDTAPLLTPPLTPSEKAADAPPPAKPSGWFILKWMEKPAANGPSKQAKPEDVTQFIQVHAFEREANDATFQKTLEQLREGDVLAYRMGKWEARKKIFTGKLNNVAYRLYKYGHLAIVVRDPEDMSKLRIFSSESFKGANMREGLDTLRTHSFDVYRLDKWSRVDRARLNEFVQIAMKKSGKWYGYDFSGMFGLWNSNLKPTKPEEVGHDYICSTIVLTALQYSGVELDAYKRSGLLDLVTPGQVVASKGRIITPPEVTFDVELAQREPQNPTQNPETPALPC